MAKALRMLGFPVGRSQAQSLMREAGVWVHYRRRYRVTTDSHHRQPVFENRLKRDFSAKGPDQVYAGDITYGGLRKAGYIWPWLSTCTHAK